MIMIVNRLKEKNIGQSKAIGLRQNFNMASGMIRGCSHFLGYIQIAAL